MEYLDYGEEEIAYLKSKDGQLGQVIDRVGFIKREVIPDLFTALVFSIVGQQVSPKAASTISKRLTALLGKISPESIISADLDSVRGCGISSRKAKYIKGIADAVFNGDLNLDGLNQLSDEEVIKKLTSLPGVGRWTAEMLMIFAMRRPDVVSYNDLAIRRGMMKVYGLSEITEEQFMYYRKRYSPYGTVASLYLWAASKE
jgi:DNA-3-methyladenine glycosylase II